MFFMTRRLRRFTLFPYTTLFRSDVSPKQESVCTDVGLKCEFGSGTKADRNRWVYRDWQNGAWWWIGIWSKPVSPRLRRDDLRDRKSTRLNSSHVAISYAVFCLKK